MGQSIAGALRKWRDIYAPFFESVIVACNDRRTADILDKSINATMYANALSDHPVFSSTLCAWHWEADILSLHINNALLSIARHCRKRQSRKNSKELPSSRRNSKDFSIRPSATPSSFGGSMAQPKASQVEPTAAVGGSRKQFEHYLENRRRDSNAHHIDPIEDVSKTLNYQAPKTETSANAGVARALAMQVFNTSAKARRQSTHRKDAEKIEKGLGSAMEQMAGAESEGGESEEETERKKDMVDELFEEVQDLAAQMSARLNVFRARKETKKRGAS